MHLRSNVFKPGRLLLLGSLCFAHVLLSGVNACTGSDLDQDGWSATEGDCNDKDATVYPQAPEVCDSKDNNCDGAVDEGLEQPYYLDADADGYGVEPTMGFACAAPAGTSLQAGDCQDANAAIHPGVADGCDGVDNDCDGVLDEQPDKVWYLDDDADGYGTDTVSLTVCAQPEGYAPQSGDCALDDPAVNPGAVDACDGVDSNCNGAVDDEPERLFFLDADGDGIGRTDSYVAACTAGPGEVNRFGDCDDTSAAVSPKALEICDGQDNNCDGRVDEGRTYYRDQDADGYGREDDKLTGCAAPAGYSLSRGDCNDARPDVYPGATDSTADSLDADCGGTTAQEPSVGLRAHGLYSIQGAMDAASDGMTLWVAPGTWSAVNASPGGKKIRLVSTQGPEKTTLDAMGQGVVFQIGSAEDEKTMIDGFSITGGLSELAGGLLISGASPRLENLHVWGNRALESGGGARLQYSASRLHACTFTGNATLGYMGFSSWNYGGGVASLTSTIILEASRLVYNLTGGSLGAGAGLYASEGSLEAHHLLVLGNVMTADATGPGGGISLSYGVVATLSDLSVLENHAGTSGGGLDVSSAELHLADSVFANNSALAVGGGITVYASTAELTGLLLEGNQAGNGGGLLVASSTVTADQLRVYQNQALDVSYGGGGITVYEGALTLSHADVARNQATAIGGGLLLAAPTGSISSSIFRDNQAGVSGGGIYSPSGAPLFSQVAVVGNRSPLGAGVQLYTTNARPAFRGAILAWNAGYNLYLEPGGPIVGYPAPTFAYCDLYNPPELPNLSSGDPGPTNLFVEPQFLAYSEAGYPTDLHLAQGSPLVDVGDPTQSDADASPTDLGPFGTSSGASWDLDGDGLKNWFWPGTRDQAPDGLDPAAFDCNDLDSSPCP